MAWPAAAVAEPGTPSGEVTIGGRVFTLGTVYAPRRGMYGYARRQLVGYVADSPLPGGKVTVAVLHSGRRQIMAGTEWVAWAGEPVEDRSGDVGR
jgi:hypothetical protein